MGNQKKMAKEFFRRLHKKHSVEFQNKGGNCFLECCVD